MFHDYENDAFAVYHYNHQASENVHGYPNMLHTIYYTPINVGEIIVF